MAKLKGTYTGPESHISTDLTTNNPVQDSHPTGDKSLYPKYKYHQEKSPTVVNSQDEEDDLEGDWQDTPHEKPAAASVRFTDEELNEKTREDLVFFGNHNYGLALQADQPKEDLIAAIKKVAN